MSDTKWAATIGDMPVKVTITKQVDMFVGVSYRGPREIKSEVVDAGTLFATEEGALTYKIQSCDTLIEYQTQKRQRLFDRLKGIGDGK